jgi:hypothetical protein
MRPCICILALFCISATIKYLHKHTTSFKKLSKVPEQTQVIRALLSKNMNITVNHAAHREISSAGPNILYCHYIISCCLYSPAGHLLQLRPHWIRITNNEPDFYSFSLLVVDFAFEDERLIDFTALLNFCLIV